MIHSLRKKMILISAVSITLVITIVYLAICIFGTLRLNNIMDTLTDTISENDGYFPVFDHGHSNPHRGSMQMGIITPETRSSTRFFSIWIDGDGNIIRENVASISSVTREQAREYAQEAMERRDERGWISDYRYKIVSVEQGSLIVFVNGSMNKEVMRQFVLIALPVLIGSGFVILLFIILFSKWAVRPVAESYEKQKQFITDANHELKTPLTLILSNLDIVESELGKNEWLDDIRNEGKRMGVLVNQLVTLARMDEDHSNLEVSPFDLATVVSDTVSEFQPLAEEKGKTLYFKESTPILYSGDEGLIRRLISILLDNAVKYCDTDGVINVTVSAKRNPVFTVENTYKEVDTVEMNRLFDRFYRADKARSYSESFGIGLSIAKAIAKNHHGDIASYKKGDDTIGFKVVLK